MKQTQTLADAQLGAGLALSEEAALERPRLAPIDRPPNLITRLIGWYFKWKFGKVMAPVRVIYPRFPQMVRPHLGLIRAAQGKLALDPLLVHLVEIRTSQLNGCSFCADLHRAVAHLQHADAKSLARRKLGSLDDLDSGVFTDQERAALRYTEEVTRERQVQDRTFAELSAHFSEEQIVQLTFVNAVVNYTNLMAVPLGLGSDGFCAIVDERARAH